MTEREFWRFLEHLWKTRGRVPQVSGGIDGPGPILQTAGQYLRGHAILPQDYDKISNGAIINMGGLLLEKKVQHKTKEAIMMVLAHHGSIEAFDILRRYSIKVDKGLEVFTEMALDECRMWNK